MGIVSPSAEVAGLTTAVAIGVVAPEAAGLATAEAIGVAAPEAAGLATAVEMGVAQDDRAAGEADRGVSAEGERGLGEDGALLTVTSLRSENSADPLLEVDGLRLLLPLCGARLAGLSAAAAGG